MNCQEHLQFHMNCSSHCIWHESHSDTIRVGQRTVAKCSSGSDERRMLAARHRSLALLQNPLTRVTQYPAQS